MMDGWRIHKALRSIVIAGSTFGLIYYGPEGANGVLAGLLVLIGAIAVGMGWAKPALALRKKAAQKFKLLR